MSLKDLYEQYHDRVMFLVVYIREAHPKDGWWLGGGATGLAIRFYVSGAALDVYDPKTMEERRQVAGRCEAELKYGVPTLVDDMNDSVNRAYAALPTRMYLIGLDGRVAYAGELGPWGFKPYKLQEAIEGWLEANPEFVREGNLEIHSAE